MNNHYNKNLKKFANGLRNQGTKAEVRLWCELLRNKKMLGFPFLRQRPIDKYIADFFCKDLKLIIEVDGYSHGLEEVYSHDLEREKKLNELGYTILRFHDEEIMKNIYDVGLTVENWIRDRNGEIIPLPPSKGDISPTKITDNSEVSLIKKSYKKSKEFILLPSKEEHLSDKDYR